MHVRVRTIGAALACLALMLIGTSLPAEELTLSQAVNLALNNNPTIAAGRLSADAARQSAKGARALTNPELQVAPSIAGDAGSDSALLFSQPLEINGGRRVRGEIASSQAAAASFDSDTTQRNTVLRVSQIYWEVARAQELVRLNKENIAYLETVKAAVQKQYDVGALPGAQLLKMDVELARARQELAQAELDLSQSRSELNALLARPTNTDFTVSEPLVFREQPMDRSALVASAIAGRPEIRSIQAQVAAAQGQIRAARLQRVPDLALQARRETLDENSDGGVAIAINLPLLDWGSVKAEKRRAELAAQSREKELQATRNTVALDVDQAIQRVNAAAQIVREYQGGVLSKSEELAAMARKGYEKGANNYLEMLEAQRTLRSVRSDYYSALAEHAKAIAQLEWATGCGATGTGKPEVKK